MSKLGQLFWIFLKIGTFTFGGGYAMIPLIQKEIVDNKKWLSLEEFVDIMAIAQAAPGAIAINAATYSGYKVAGSGGALVAALAATLPSFVILLLVAVFFARFENQPAVIAFFKGVRPAIVALILAAAYSVGKTVLKSAASIGLTIVAFLALIVFNMHPIFVIILGALAGIVYYLYTKLREVEKNAS